MAARRIGSRWYADFRFQHADGRVERIRKRSPVASKAGAEEFERQLRTGLMTPSRITKEVPTFSAYAAEFMKTYVVANNKPSERSMKASILKHHLLPAFGEMRLDSIKMHPIEMFKASLLAKGLSRKRVNNILAVLGKMLRYAHEVELLDVVPRVKLLKVPPQEFDFLRFEELSRLLEAVKGDPERMALLLMGSDAGLRQGEMVALEAWISWRERSPCGARRGGGLSARPRVGATEKSHSRRGFERHCARIGIFGPSSCFATRMAAPHAIRDRGGAPVRVQARRAPVHRIARVSAHLCIAPGDAGRGTEGDPGAARSWVPFHDAEVRSPRSECPPRSHRTSRFWAAGGQRRSGDGLKYLI